MEAKKQSTSSSSSFTNDLFGSNESSASSSSSGLFNSIFPPPSKAYIRDYIRSQENKKNYDYATGQGSAIHSVDNGDRTRNPKTDMSLSYQHETSQPCHLSSSIYYGGQDIYTNPSSTKNTTGHSTQYTKDGEDDGRASRGNWWQGSLYY